MSTTTTNFGWTVPSDTDLVKDGAAAIRTALGGVDTSFVDLKGGTTGQVLSKASGSDLDFTWVAQDDSNAIQNAIVDAKGDLIVGASADTPARLAVGTNGYVLTANSSATNGVEWAAAASGGGLTQIQSSSLTGSTVNFNSISGSYKHLQLVIKNAYSSTADWIYIRCNSDSGTNYARRAFNLSGTSLGSGTSTQSAFYAIQTPTSSAFDNNAFVVIDFYNYTDTSGGQFMIVNGSGYDGSNKFGMLGNGVYNKSAAITSISVNQAGGTFSGGTAILYGVN